MRLGGTFNHCLTGGIQNAIQLPVVTTGIIVHCDQIICVSHCEKILSHHFQCPGCNFICHKWFFLLLAQVFVAFTALAHSFFDFTGHSWPEENIFGSSDA